MYSADRLALTNGFKQHLKQDDAIVARGCAAVSNPDSRYQSVAVEPFDDGRKPVPCMQCIFCFGCGERYQRWFRSSFGFTVRTRQNG